MTSTRLLSQTFALFNYQFTSTFNKIQVNCQQAMALDLPSYDIFAPQKVPLLKISDDVIACTVVCDLPPLIKNLGYAYGYNGYLPQVTVTSYVIGQFYVGLCFGLALVLVMIRVGAKFLLWIWLTLSLKLALTISNLLWCLVCDLRCDCNR